MDLREQIKEMNHDYEKKMKAEKKAATKKKVEQIEFLESTITTTPRDWVLTGMYVLEALFYIFGICAAIKILF